MLKQTIKKVYNDYCNYKTFKYEEKNLKSLKYLYKDIVLTKEQIDAIDKLWLNNYGKKINKDYHRLYMSYNGKFNEKYFPETYFASILQNKLNPKVKKDCLSDKVLTQYFFNNLKEEKVRVVKNFVYNSNGYFYCENGIITYEDALKILYNIGQVIIKPTVDSDSGDNVKLLNIKNGVDIISDKKVEEILRKYDKNYTIQEKIIQHPSFAKLNSSSVNTIRVDTYVCDGKVYAAPTAMRIGRKNSLVDNACAGGISVGVDKNGCLMEYGYFKNGKKHKSHPDNGVVFNGYKIPRVLDMIQFAIDNHYRIPNIGIIAWDLTLDINENIVIIETNTSYPSIWFPQYTTGEAFFGDNTEKMIQMLKK